MQNVSGRGWKTGDSTHKKAWHDTGDAAGTRDLTAWFGKPVCRIGKQVIGYVPPAYSVLIQCCLRQAAFYAAFIFFREAVYGRQRTDVQWMPVCHKLSYANIAQRSCSFLKNLYPADIYEFCFSANDSCMVSDNINICYERSRHGSSFYFRIKQSVCILPLSRL